MIRMILAAAAAFALVAATPALACPNCHDCPQHKDGHAAAPAPKDGDKGGKPAACPCVAAGKDCQCGEKCQCPHCAAKHPEKKDAKKT